MNKKPFESKKFVALFFCTIVLAGVLVAALFTQTFGWPMAFFMACGMIAIGALSIGYVLGQKQLDQYLAAVSKGLIKEKEKD